MASNECCYEWMLCLMIEVYDIVFMFYIVYNSIFAFIGRVV